VCIALCTIVAHNIAQNRPDSFPPYPPDDHHISDDVYLREGGLKCAARDSLEIGRKKSPFWHQSTTLSGYIFGTKACLDNRKKFVKQQYLIHMS